MSSFRNFFFHSRDGRSGRGEPPLTVRERVRAFRNLPPLFRLIWESSALMTIGNIVLRLLRAVVPLATLYVGKLIIDEIVHLAGSEAARDLTHLWFLVSAEFAIAIGSDLLSRGIALLDGLLGDLLSNRTSVRLMEHAARLELERFEDASFYDKLERARRQTTSRMTLMSQVLSQGQDMIAMIFLAGGVVAFNPWLVGLLVIALIPAFVGEAHFNSRSYSLMYSWTPERRELDYLRYAGASDETAKEVKIFGLSSFLTDRYRTLADRFFTENRSLAVRRAGWGALLAAIGSTGYYAAYVMIILQTVAGAISIGTLTFLAGSFARLRSLLEGILARFSSIAEGALYLRDLFDFFDMQPSLTSPLNPHPFPRPLRRGITFENVGFKYSNTDRWALRGVTFTLTAGEKLALVGENGAGKTTLAKLLARLYDPTEGRITLDDIDLREYDLEELRKEISVIFQDFVHYHMTAADNIAVGHIDGREDRSRIVGAAERSLANTVIDKLPAGYDQIVGRRFATGVELSGGEWQKIALARAYMRDAQLLILDEPTASLDARAEHEVFQRFADLTATKTSVLISHRFSTVRMADRILVLADGVLRESGSHEELLRLGGRYAELFTLQARGYR
jgi:ATP-binding cassette, subfamily B, bacterial